MSKNELSREMVVSFIENKLKIYKEHMKFERKQPDNERFVGYLEGCVETLTDMLEEFKCTK